MELHVLLLLMDGCVADLSAQSFMPARSMHDARLQRTSTLLKDGNLLVPPRKMDSPSRSPHADVSKLCAQSDREKTPPLSYLPILILRK